MANDSPTTLDAVLAWAAAGYYVAPVRVSLAPDGKKLPQFGVHWQTASTRDEATLRAWWGPGQPFEQFGVAIDCERSGIVAVDLDLKPGVDGMAQWVALGAAPANMGQTTRAGGRHLIYRANETTPIGNSSSDVAPGVDTRGIGGVIFAAPTTLPDGTSYALATPLVPVAELLPAPVHLLERAAWRGARERTAGAPEVIDPAQAEAIVRQAAQAMLQAVEGLNWNTSLNTLANVLGRYHGAIGHGAEDAWAHLLSIVQQRPDAAGGLDDKSTETAWRAINDGVADRWALLSVDSLIDLTDPARLGGGAIPFGSPDDAAAALWAEFLDDAGISQLPPPTYLLDGYVPANSLGRLFGPSGSYKSFVTIDLAACIANGLPWHGRETKQASVWYVVAEGASGVAKRLQAWRMHYRQASTGVKYLPRAVQLLGEEHAALRLLARRERPGLIIYDTQARSTVGVNENDAKEMGMVVEACEQLRRDSGGTVLLVHHTGHDTARSRGSSAVFAAMDFELMISRTSALGITLDVVKQKNDEELRGLKLGVVGVQDSGSLVLVPMAELPSAEDNDTSFTDADLGYEPVPDKPAETTKQRRLLQFMAKDAAVGGAGRTRAEAFAHLGYSTKDDRTAKRAWDAMLRLGMIEYVRGRSGPCRYVEPVARVVQDDED